MYSYMQLAEDVMPEPVQNGVGKRPGMFNLSVVPQRNLSTRSNAPSIPRPACAPAKPAPPGTMQKARATENLRGKSLGTSPKPEFKAQLRNPKAKQDAMKRGPAAFSAQHVAKQCKYHEASPKIADIREQREEAALPCSIEIVDHLGDFSLVMGIDRSVENIRYKSGGGVMGQNPGVYFSEISPGCLTGYRDSGLGGRQGTC